MFREIILPIFRSTRLCVTACGVMHPPRCCRPKAFQISYCRCRIAGIAFQISHYRCRTAGIAFQVSYSRCRVAGIAFQISYCRCRIAGIAFQIWFVDAVLQVSLFRYIADIAGHLSHSPLHAYNSLLM